MKIKLLFFGNLREKAGRQQLELEGIDTLSACREQIEVHIPELKGSVYLTAVNQDLVKGEHPLQDGDEIAVMPPFAGG